ncbi:unnamed protein product [Caenorhabditis angaria]|uniref:DUF38 domain-containing protein n=1 Tax=Caenorhabditis angaria TaxID=860376 RepID=A0A9P1N1C6_9PELO|nr:unnamed protein product [Caenorhabditis angaria]
MCLIILIFLEFTQILCQYPYQIANSLIFKRYLSISDEFELNRWISSMFYFRDCVGNEYDLRATDFIDERIAQRRAFEKNPKLLNVLNASFVGEDVTSLNFILEDHSSTRKISEFHARFSKYDVLKKEAYSPEQGWRIDYEHEQC